jgi:SnoaL-like domain
LAYSSAKPGCEREEDESEATALFQKHGLGRRRLNQHTEASIGHHSDWREIILVVDEIDNAVDAKDWQKCRNYFTEEIYADFTSLAGGSPGNMPADDLVGTWATNLYAEKRSHHMRSNHRVTIDGDRAEVFSKGYALNILHRPTGSDLWEVWGNYTHTLERMGESWKCSGMTFVVTYARGNEMARDYLPEQ